MQTRTCVDCFSACYSVRYTGVVPPFLSVNLKEVHDGYLSNFTSLNGSLTVNPTLVVSHAWRTAPMKLDDLIAPALLLDGAC